MFNWEKLMEDLNMDKATLSKKLGLSAGYISTKIRDRKQYPNSWMYKSTEAAVHNILDKYFLSIEDYIISPNKEQKITKPNRKKVLNNKETDQEIIIKALLNYIRGNGK